MKKIWDEYKNITLKIIKSIEEDKEVYNYLIIEKILSRIY